MQKEQISFTDAVRQSSSRMLKEVELQTPLHFQMYSDMYKEYVHALDNTFGMFLQIEKSIIEDPGITDPNLARAFGSTVNAITDQWLTCLDSYGEFLHWYSGARSEGTRVCDRYMHDMINAYTRMAEMRWHPHTKGGRHND